MIHNGKLSINRVTHSHAPDNISIKIYDGANLKELIEVVIDPKEFALAVTGYSHQDCKIELGDIDLIGKVREEKIEKVKFPQHLAPGVGDDVVRAREILAPFEENGWVVVDINKVLHFSSTIDRFSNGTEMKSVRFERFVTPQAVNREVKS